MKLPAEFLHECFRYDRLTGLLYWRHRPSYHFSGRQGEKAFNSRFPGTLALNHVGSHGYRAGHVSFEGRPVGLLAHQAIWVMHKGLPLPPRIDHEDTDRLNNRLENLRPATFQQNCQNSAPKHRDATRLKGAFKYRSRWQAAIMVDYKKIYLGTFATEAEAHAAYCLASRQHHGAFGRTA